MDWILEIIISVFIIGLVFLLVKTLDYFVDPPIKDLDKWERRRNY